MDHKTQKMPSRLLCLCLVAVMLLAMVPVITPTAEAVSAEQTVYFKPNSDWKSSNAWFAAYFFNNSNKTEEWSKMTDSDGDGIYEVTVPSGYPNVIFCRMNSANTSAMNWGNKWNQTEDLELPTDNKNFFTLNNGWVNKGTWSEYQGSTTPTNPTETTPTTPPSETLPTSSTERIIYFDATLSKLSYEGNGGNTIPSGNNKVYCHYWIQGSGGTTKEMTKLNTVVRGDNEYSDLYYARISKSATHVLFFSSNSSSNFPNNSAQTADQKLPTDASNNCFYADSSDSCLFAGAKRNGYWGEVCNIRSAEFMKNTDIVDIQTGTIPNLDPKKAIYINTTLYDYYTDYELNGNNRDGFSYTSDSKLFASHRVWVPFRHFNQALSDYYSKENALVPIYTGHFQPSIGNNGFKFNDIESNMDLYGYMDGQAYVPLSTSQNGFMSVNNSILDIEGGQPGWERAAQGIVHDQLSADGSLLIDDKNQGTAPMPYFNEAFINGNNVSAK